MSACETKLNNKLEIDDDDGSPKVKHPRRSSTPPQHHTTKITNLNDDCLKKIFDQLDVFSLFNVAVANAHLRPSAAAVYKRKFANGKQVHIQNSVANNTLAVSKPNVIGNQIMVNGIKLCLQYLRCMGSTIDQLRIQYDGWNDKQCRYIHHYIGKYCTNNLISIDLRDKPNVPFKSFKNPFVNVSTIEVFSGYLGNQLSLFQQWFPNIRTLQLNNVRMNGVYNGTPFHHLQHLRIEYNRSVFWHMTDECVNRLLHACSQLKSLKINSWDNQRIPLNTLLNAIEDNPMICNLAVSMPQCSIPVDGTEIERIVTEHPILVELNLDGYEFTAKNAIVMIKGLNLLKNVVFQMNDKLEYNRFKRQLDRKWQLSASSLKQGHRRIITAKC